MSDKEGDTRRNLIDILAEWNLFYPAVVIIAGVIGCISTLNQSSVTENPVFFSGSTRSTQVATIAPDMVPPTIYSSENGNSRYLGNGTFEVIVNGIRYNPCGKMNNPRYRDTFNSTLPIAKNSITILRHIGHGEISGPYYEIKGEEVDIIDGIHDPDNLEQANGTFICVNLFMQP